MIATGSARCERPSPKSLPPRPQRASTRPRVPAPVPRCGAPHHRLAGGASRPARPHLPYTRRPSRVQQTAIGCTHGCTPASRANAYSMWTTSPGMWTARRPEIFSAHRPWTASPQVAGLRETNRGACPHPYPQLAHSPIGVSAQNFHRVVHTVIGRRGAGPTRLS
jgi:hypothetical protein